VEKLRKDRVIEFVEGLHREVVVGVFKQALQGCAQVNKSSWRKYLIHFAEFIRKERMVGIPRGEFANHRKPLDLGKGAGKIQRCIPKRFQAQEVWSH
jgi:hypothetical protein